MAQVVSRAAQNNFPATKVGGTMDYGHSEFMSIAPFMDAVENEDTTFLNGLKKGKSGSARREHSGIKSATPRGSLVASTVIPGDTSLPVASGHGARFQQGHVLTVTASNGDRELVWVNADPSHNSLPVKRAQGGTTALTFAAGDKIAIVGTAILQLADYPLGVITRGGTSWNTWMKFATHLQYSEEAEKTKTFEFPNGGQLDKDMLQKGKDLKRDLNAALLLSRRQEGDPDPSNPSPSMMGGAQFWVEQAGNVFNQAGAQLSMDVINDALMELDDRFGSNKGKVMLMSIRDKQILNRIAHPSRFQAGMTGNSVDYRTDKIMTDVGTYDFESDREMPRGEIWIFDRKEFEYAAFDGMDWRQKDVPTKGDYTWRGISGTFTFRPGRYQASAVIKGYDTNQANYPEWGKSAS